MHHEHPKPFRLRATGTMLDVEIETIRVGPQETEIPWLDPYKVVEALAAADKLNYLGADQDLLEFWRRMAKTEPGQVVFQKAARGELNLAHTIPICSHRDEGRGKKRKAILLWSMRGALGTGTELFRATHDELEQLRRQGLNMDGSLSTRFLHLAVPKAVYGKNAQPVWDDLARYVTSSYRQLAEDGVLWKGQRHHFICIGLTGDNPFLSKIAHLDRSFARVPKKSGEMSLHGIC